MRTTVTFSTHDLTEEFIVMNVQRPLAKRTVSLVDVPGRDGQILGNVTYDTATITMDIAICEPGTTRRRRSALMRRLAGILSSRELINLAFSDDGGKYYKAVASGGDIRRYIDADVVEGVTFTCPDPVMYGETKTFEFEFPFDSPVHVLVGGNYPAYPSFDLNVQGAPATGAVEISTAAVPFSPDVTDDGVVIPYMGEVAPAINMWVPIANDRLNHVEVDCEKRICRVDGVATVPSLNSDWIVLAPGEQTVNIVCGTEAGEGNGAFTFTERWV